MIKLLIVDDETIIRETLSKHIPWENLGVRVIGTAQDGLEAYDIIMDEDPDIVIRDAGVVRPGAFAANQTPARRGGIYRSVGIRGI